MWILQESGRASRETAKRPWRRRGDQPDHALSGMPPTAARVRQQTPDGMVIRFLLGRPLRIDEFRIPKAVAEVRTAHAAIHRKANAATPQELNRFDFADSRSDQIAEFLVLAFADRSLQILNPMGALYSRQASRPQKIAGSHLSAP